MTRPRSSGASVGQLSSAGATTFAMASLGLEVAGIVFSLVSAFRSGIEIVDRVGDQRRRRDRRKPGSRHRRNDASSAASSAQRRLDADEARLSRSLGKGPQHISREYERDLALVGDGFASGDRTACPRLILGFNICVVLCAIRIMTVSLYRFIRLILWLPAGQRSCSRCPYIPGRHAAEAQHRPRQHHLVLSDVCRRQCCARGAAGLRISDSAVGADAQGCRRGAGKSVHEAVDRVFSELGRADTADDGASHATVSGVEGQAKVQA